MTAAHDHGGATAAFAPTESTPAWRLVLTLALGGAFAGGLVANVYQRTLPAIQRAADAKIGGAVHEVLRAPARLDTLYLVGDKLSRTPPAGVEIREVQKVFIGSDDKGARIGVAVEASEPGFADEVRLMIGFNPATGALTGYAMLGQKETPGLGDQIEKDTVFVGQFRGKLAPIKGTKNSTTDASTVQTITGATISSRVVIKIINNALALWQPRLAVFEKEGGK